MKKYILTVASAFSLAYSTSAQEIENLVKAADDANKIAQAYAAPALEGLI